MHFNPLHIQAFAVCLFGALSSMLYRHLRKDPNLEAGYCERVKLLRNSLQDQPHIHSIFLCDYSPITSDSHVNNCSCSDEAGDTCMHISICVLWTSSPESDNLRSAILALEGSSEFVTSSKQPVQDVITSTKKPVQNIITHFFVTLYGGHTVHFANWFQQDDGSWWFDKLPSQFKIATAAVEQFYVGKYEGWMKSVSVRRAGVLDVPADWSEFRHRLLASRFVACDHERAHRFHLAEGRDASADAKRFRHRAWRLLAAAAGALDQLGVPFWLSSGTCLGYYRQCDFVPYMGDVDIGVSISSLREWTGDARLPSLAQLTEALAARRLRLVHRFGRPSDSLELSFRSPDHVKLDVFFFYEDGDVVWNGGTQARTGRKFRYNFDRFELCWTVFRDLRVRVPCDTERYLRANYGPDWRVPQPVWDWKSSPPNVVPNGVWSEQERHEVVQLMEQ